MFLVYQELVEFCGTMEVADLMDRRNNCIRRAAAAAAVFVVCGDMPGSR
jgi:hypothetical protein